MILIDKKNEGVKFDIIPKTNEEYISMTNGFFNIIDGSYIYSYQVV